MEKNVMMASGNPENMLDKEKEKIVGNEDIAKEVENAVIHLANKTLKDANEALLAMKSEILKLNNDKKALEDKLSEAQDIIKTFSTEANELITYMKDNHVKDGKWVKIKWYQFGKWYELGKACFRFVKNVLKAFNIKIGLFEDIMSKP